MYEKPTIKNIGERPFSQAEINLVRRARSLTRDGNSITTMRLVSAGQEWYLAVNNGRLERLGEK